MAMTTNKLIVIDNSFPYPWSTLSVFYHVFFCLFSRFSFTPLSCNEHSELYLVCIRLTEKKVIMTIVFIITKMDLNSV